MRNDCIVIGAGVIGLSIAWRARQAGLSVIVLDSESRHGASRVAAGMLAPVTEASFGEEELLQLGLESARRYPGFLQELSDSSGRKLGHLAQGTLFVALDRDQLEALRRLYEFQVALGLEVQWLGREECRRREPLLHPSVRGGVFAADDREIDPRQLSAALMSVLETDAELRLSSEVAALVESGGSVTGVRLDDGEELSASAVVMAAGCWSGTIEGVPKEISESTRPVKGQILTLRAFRGEDPYLSHVVKTEEIYLVPRPTGEVVVGASVEEQGFDLTPTAGWVYELLRSAAETMPALREAAFGKVDVGLRPGSRDNAPLLGETSKPNLIAATGHYRNGVLLAAVTADAIAELLVKGEAPPEILPFSPKRFA